jgi:hypothetical protein
METKVVDSFEIMPGMAGTDHTAGVVVVFDGVVCSADRWPAIGTRITIHTLAGRTTTSVGELKRHGAGVSIFFAGLNSNVVPIGSLIKWSDKPVVVGRTSKV